MAFNGADHPGRLRANVVLPDGFDPATAYPVLYLLHGVGDSSDHWRRPQSGEVLETARGFPGIVVMPEHRPQQGVHDWPYWRRHLRESIAWDLFAPVPERPAAWSYGTIAAQGSMRGVRYAFVEPPSGVVRLEAQAGRLRGTGSDGSRVVLRGAQACTVTATLPFDIALPGSDCDALRLSVRPGTVTRAPRRSP